VTGIEIFLQIFWQMFYARKYKESWI